MLAFEFRKLFTKKKLYIFLIIVLGAVLLNACMNSLITSINIEGVDRIEETNLQFTKNVYNHSMIGMLGPIFIAIFVCEDAGNDYLKNIYAKGYNRFTVFFAKFISNLVAMLIMYVFAILACVIIGSILLPSGSLPKGFALSIIINGLLLVANTSFFFAISMLVSKLALSITFNIVAPLIISAIFQLFDLILKSTSVQVSKFWIDNAITNVAESSGGAPYLIGIVVAIIYTAIFLVGGSYLCSKKDNK